MAAAAAAAVGRLARAGALPAPTSVRHTACCRPAAAAAASPSPMDAPESSSAESHTVFHRTRCVHGHSAGWCLQVAAAAPPGKTLLEWWDSSFRLIQVGRWVAPPYMYLKPCEGRSADPSSEAPCTCSLHRLPAQAPCTGQVGGGRCLMGTKTDRPAHTAPRHGKSSRRCCRGLRRTPLFWDRVRTARTDARGLPLASQGKAAFP